MANIFKTPRNIQSKRNEVESAIESSFGYELTGFKRTVIDNFIEYAAMKIIDEIEDRENKIKIYTDSTTGEKNLLYLPVSSLKNYFVKYLDDPTTISYDPITKNNSLHTLEALNHRTNIQILEYEELIFNLDKIIKNNAQHTVNVDSIIGLIDSIAPDINQNADNENKYGRTQYAEDAKKAMFISEFLFFCNTTLKKVQNKYTAEELATIISKAMYSENFKILCAKIGEYTDVTNTNGDNTNGDNTNGDNTNGANTNVANTNGDNTNENAMEIEGGRRKKTKCIKKNKKQKSCKKRKSNKKIKINKK